MNDFFLYSALIIGGLVIFLYVAKLEPTPTGMGIAFIIIFVTAYGGYRAGVFSPFVSVIAVVLSSLTVLGFMILHLFPHLTTPPEEPPQPDPEPPDDTSIEDKITELLNKNKR